MWTIRSAKTLGELFSPPGFLLLLRVVHGRRLAPVRAIPISTCGWVRPKEIIKVKCPHLSELAPWPGIAKVLCPILMIASTVLAPAAMARGREQVGEIVSRPPVRASENALSAIQKARESV